MDSAAMHDATLRKSDSGEGFSNVERQRQSVMIDICFWWPFVIKIFVTIKAGTHNHLKPITEVVWPGVIVSKIQRNHLE